LWTGLGWHPAETQDTVIIDFRLQLASVFGNISRRCHENADDGPDQGLNQGPADGQSVAERIGYGTSNATGNRIRAIHRDSQRYSTSSLRSTWTSHRSAGEVTECPLIVAADAIADACDVLRSAIADLRNIIHQVDRLMDLPVVASANAVCRVGEFTE
jgi:hypothetical protein